MIKIEGATIYRGGKRRWFTLRAACRAEARAKYRERCRATGEDWNPTDSYWAPRIDLLARLYMASAKKGMMR